MMASRQSGFTLVEALVAVLVLSIGLLGVAAMQLKSLQSAHAGYQRATASLAAQDLVELLWEELDSTTENCPGAGDVDQAGWAERWNDILPGLNATPIVDDTDCVYDIEVRWSEGRFSGEGDPVFEYTVRLPKGGA